MGPRRRTATAAEQRRSFKSNCVVSLFLCGSLSQAVSLQYKRGRAAPVYISKRAAKLVVVAGLARCCPAKYTRLRTVARAYFKSSFAVTYSYSVRPPSWTLADMGKTRVYLWSHFTFATYHGFHDKAKYKMLG